MALLFLLGVLLLGCSGALVLKSIVWLRQRVSSQVRQIEAYGFNQEPVIAQPVERSLATLAERAGRWAMTAVPKLKPLEARELRAAGMYEVSAETVHGYRVLGGVTAWTLLLLVAISGSGSLLMLVVLVIIGVMLWYLPPAMIRTRGDRRLEHIDRDLPELIDVLTATIEAGLGVGGSLQMVAGRFDGPLGVELRLTLQEQTMGLSTERALENMLERCETPSIRAFVRAVLQGDALGVSIGTTLRNLATETRKRRRAAARERAQRAPVKLLFPLVFLIFPALLIVLLYPTVHNIVQVLGGG